MKRTASLAAIAVTSALFLAGCSGGQSAEPAASESATSSTATPSGAAGASTEQHNDEDTMFAQMMIPHHQRAVEMSEMLLAKDDVPAEVADFAQGVIDAQGPEIEQLTTMLTAWGEEATASMDHGSGTDGMMTEEDMQSLDEAQGTEAAQLYLEQMTAHHRDAIEMAQTEVDSGQNAEAIQMAETIITDQEAEITEMEQLLAGLS